MTRMYIAVGLGLVCLSVGMVLLGTFGWRRNGNHR